MEIDFKSSANENSDETQIAERHITRGLDRASSASFFRCLARSLQPRAILYSPFPLPIETAARRIGDAIRLSEERFHYIRFNERVN